MDSTLNPYGFKIKGGKWMKVGLPSWKREERMLPGLAKEGGGGGCCPALMGEESNDAWFNKKWARGMMSCPHGRWEQRCLVEGKDRRERNCLLLLQPTGRALRKLAVQPRVPPSSSGPEAHGTSPAADRGSTGGEQRLSLCGNLQWPQAGRADPVLREGFPESHFGPQRSLPFRTSHGGLCALGDGAGHRKDRCRADRVMCVE